MIRLFLYSINARISYKDTFQTISAKILGSDRNEVQTTLERHFPKAKEIQITSIGRVEADVMSYELIDKIYRYEYDRRNGTREVKRSVKPSSFSIWRKDNKPLWS